MKKFILFSFVLISLLIPGWSSGKENANVLINDIWALESIEGKIYKNYSPDEQQPLIEIHLKEERLIGNTGCNHMNGRVSVEENKISFSEITTTKMFCPGDNEIRFLSALNKVNNYKIEKLRLYLFEDDNELLTFRKID